jgi:hypothetical protein
MFFGFVCVCVCVCVCVVLGFKGPYTCWAGALPLEACVQSSFALVIFQIGSRVFPGAGPRL